MVGLSHYSFADRCRSATIVVKIKNSGDSGYMHDEYGDTIMVERHFNRSGTSGFKLKSANGRIISTRRADLDDICDFYALQIDNPMNVLSQDNARQFITSSSPQDKYKFFVKGVQLEQLDHDYGVLEETIDNIESKLGTRHEDIAVLKDRRDKAAQRLALSDQHEHLREKVRELRRQHAWAQVEEAEQVCSISIEHRALELTRRVTGSGQIV
jgi:chromosome segregation ATPase